MLAAIGILFVDEETVFWMLVAIIEKLLPAQYFTPGLLGAQADQVGGAGWEGAAAAFE